MLLNNVVSISTSTSNQIIQTSADFNNLDFKYAAFKTFPFIYFIWRIDIVFFHHENFEDH